MWPVSPYVRVYTTPSGATGVQVVTKRHGKRSFRHVGSAHDAAELEVLRARAEQIAAGGQQALDLDALGGSQAPGAGMPGAGVGLVRAKRSEVLWGVLCNAWRDLGLQAAVGGDRPFAQMALAPLVEPTSKEQVPRVLGELGVDALSSRTLLRSLRRCVDRGYREAIQAALHDHVADRGDLSLVLYDVTTLYFETDKEDDLRKVGFSKERRVDPQIIVGMLTDRAGFPLQVGCWQGNKAETKTIIPMVQDFLQAHDIAPKGLVVVADAGMLSADNLAALDQAGLSFIVGSKTTKAPWDLADHIRLHGNAYHDGQLIEATTPKHRRAPTPKSKDDQDSPGDDCGRHEPKAWDPQDNPNQWRVVWHYSAKRFTRDNQTLTAQWNKAQAVINGEKSSRRPRFVTGSKTDLSLDQASYQRALNAAGLKGYVTNMTSARMSAQEVLTSYQALWHIEQTWRMSKNDLKARPIFHHLKDSIEAHLTMVMASLAVARHLQDTTQTSIKKIIRTLKPIQTIDILIAGHPYTATDPITPQAQQILNALTHQT